MKHTTFTLPLIALLLAFGSAKAQVEDLIFLTFDPAPANAGDIADHPDVDNILHWVNGSMLAPDPGGFSAASAPVADFTNGVASLDEAFGRFGFIWGFEGGFEILGSLPWEIQTISFDYDVLGHEGEASLEVIVGPWSGIAPLPSTSEAFTGVNFASVSNGERAFGSVTFDFVNQLLTVTHTGVRDSATPVTTVYPAFMTPLPESLMLGQGDHLIGLLGSSQSQATAPYHDVQGNATEGADGFYRIDNFRITALPTPEPSRAMLLALAGTALVLGRRRR